MSEHEMKIGGFRLKPNGTVYWRSACTCGWMGEMTRSERVAIREWKRHIPAEGTE